MKSISVIYAGPLPQLEVEVARERYVTAIRGKSVDLPEKIASELLQRGDFLPAEQQRTAPTR